MSKSARGHLAIAPCVVLGIYTTDAKALDAQSCGGLASLFLNGCNDTQYYHICLGKNGQAGIVDFTMTGTMPDLYVPQWSSIASNCGGSKPSADCPARYWVTLQHCASRADVTKCN
jgi:hypothetical protein